MAGATEYSFPVLLCCKCSVHVDGSLVLCERCDGLSPDEQQAALRREREELDAARREKNLATKTERAALRGRLVKQGDTFAELQGSEGIVSANRANRLKADAMLSRAQRKELARLREQRRWWRREPANPKWAKPKPEPIATDAQIKVIADDVAGLFARGMVEGAGDFEDWRTRHLVRDVPITRKQLDAALGEIMNRLKQDVINDGVTHGR